MHQGSESDLGGGMITVSFPKIRATPRVWGEYEKGKVGAGQTPPAAKRGWGFRPRLEAFSVGWR